MRQYRVIDTNGNDVPEFPETYGGDLLNIMLNSNFDWGIWIKSPDGNKYAVIAILNDTIMVGKKI